MERELLHTIEEFNKQAEGQTAQMLTMTQRIERLTWFIAGLATAQLLATVGQMISASNN